MTYQRRRGSQESRSISMAIVLAILFFIPTASAATTLSIADSSALEPAAGGTVNMNFTVTRTGDLTSQLTVGFTTVADTAKPSTDFTPTTGTTTFASGSATATISIPIFGNGVNDSPSLTFAVKLTGVVNVVGPAVTVANHSDFTSGASPIAVAIGDLNGDGKPDIVTANSSGNSVSVFLNTTAPGATTPSFLAKQDFGTGSGPRSVAIGDLNGDGKPDLVVANFAIGNGNTVSVLLNTTAPGATTASFATQVTFTTGTGPGAVAIGDVNGDGKPDLIVANSVTGGNTVSVLLNTTAPGAATPAFAAKSDFTTGVTPYAVAFGDLNGDGKPDIAVVNASDNTISVLLNTTVPGAATAAFAAHVDFPTGSFPNAIVIGDLNGDGKPDLAVTSINDGNVEVFLNTTAAGATTPAFAARQNFATADNPQSVAIGDLNGDGKLDLVTASVSTNGVSMLINTTAPGATKLSFSARVDLVAGSYPMVAIGDFNGDGKPGVLDYTGLRTELSRTCDALKNDRTHKDDSKFQYTVAEFARKGRSTIPEKDSICIGILDTNRPELLDRRSVRDAYLFAIDEINGHGGVLKKKLDAVITESQESEFFALKANQLITRDNAVVAFMASKTVARKSALPVFQRNNSLLFTPDLYEGEEGYTVAFNTGSSPTQQIFSAAAYLLRERRKRYYLLGTDYVQAHNTNKLLKAYLLSQKVGSEDIIETYTRFGERDFKGIVASINEFSKDGMACVISTLEEESIPAFFDELGLQKLEAARVPVLSFSQTIESLKKISPAFLNGHLICGSFFDGFESSRSKSFSRDFDAYCKKLGISTVDPIDEEMVAAYSSVYVWKAAVEKANSFEPSKARAMLHGQEFETPAGFVRMDDALRSAWKTISVGKYSAEQKKFEVIWSSEKPIKPESLKFLLNPEGKAVPAPSGGPKRDNKIDPILP